MAVVVMSSMALSGCSFALSSPDANRPRNEAPECDTGKGLVGLDGLIGGSFAIASLALLGNDEGEAAALTGLLGAAFIASAIRGNSAVNECRQAMAEYGARDVDRAIDDQQVAGRIQPPAPRPKQPPTAMQPAQISDPYADEPPYQAPHANPAIAPPPVTPPAVKPAAPTKPAAPVKSGPTPPPPPPIQAEEPQDWKDFWMEVP